MNAPTTVKPAIPFDHKRLDGLLEAAGIDVLLVTSKHNVRYLLGGYHSFFFEHFQAIGISRFLPIVVYERGRPEHAAYIGCPLEMWELDGNRFWTPVVEVKDQTATAAMQRAIEHIRRLGKSPRGIGIETGFLPYDVVPALTAAFPEAKLVEALFPLEQLRAVKTPQELDYLRVVSEEVVGAMLAVFGRIEPGMTKAAIVEDLKREEISRHLQFEYCLITNGASHNRAPSSERIRAGDIISLDSGGTLNGYLGDLTRMGIVGEPDAELEDLLGVVEAIQQEARKPIRPGARGGDMVDAARALMHASPHRAYLDFTAHGLGLVSHEAPRLMDDSPIPYPADHKNVPLEAGMVVSIETTMLHPRRGFIKLEDTVAVGPDGPVGYGDGGRGWNRCGTALRGAARAA